MSDKNETENPYQPPVLSDQPLVKQEVPSSTATLNPIHWLLPIAGYAYVPVAIVSMVFSEVFGITDLDAGFLSFGLLLPGLPLYAAALFYMNRRRDKQGTNTLGLKLYHGLSLILPALWVALWFWAISSGAFATV